MEFPGEPQAINKVLEYGIQYGYGNMIYMLKLAWLLHLLEVDEKMPVATAERAVGFTTGRWWPLSREEAIPELKRFIKTTTRT